MSKAVLISIKPEWCKLIVDGKKTAEIRKSRPKLETPFKCYIYCTYGEGLIGRYDSDYPNMLIGQRVTKEAIWGNCCNGKVIGEFVCDDCSLLTKAHYQYIEKHGCIPRQRLKNYMGLGEMQELTYEDGCYGWRISDLVIYDEPKGLSSFMRPCENDLFCEVCGMYSEFADACGNSALRILRPPQSWCYVEGNLYESV